MKPRGFCLYCLKDWALSSDGRLPMHNGKKDMMCTGRYSKPITAEAAEKLREMRKAEA